MTMMSSVIAFDPRAGQPLLRRPRLLVQAARAGLSGWKRDRDLRRVLKCETMPRPEAALARLMAAIDEQLALSGVERGESVGH